MGYVELPIVSSVGQPAGSQLSEGSTVSLNPSLLSIESKALMENLPRYTERIFKNQVFTLYVI